MKTFFFLEIDFCVDLFFFFFFLESTCACVLGPWPWPRAFLSLASRVSVLGKAVLGLGLGFFLCRWPSPRALCPQLHLWYRSFYLSESFYNKTEWTVDTLQKISHSLNSVICCHVNLDPVNQ